jgi:uncharacterized protein YdeI (YjbR/CyaY-like superfamily)
MDEARFFRSAAELRRWLERNHASAAELWIGFYRLATGRRGITYPEALEEALCFGWIDGVRRKLDAERYVQRFSRRTAKSTWSLVNIRRMEALIARGVVAGPGLKAFNARDPARSGLYSFERRPQSFEPRYERLFRKAREAWAFFEAQPPGYRRTAIHWVTSAKREETRMRRLETLIDDSRRGRRIDLLK